MNTLNTTRLPFSDPEMLSVSVSRLAYPSRNIDWMANAIIIVNGEDYRNVVPAVSLVHFPINAPILISRAATLTNVVVDEVTRINPSGKNAPAQVILVGEFYPQSIKMLHQLGYSTLHFNQRDPFLQQLHIADYRQRFLPKENVQMITERTFLFSIDNIQEALPAFGFSAHIGTPILFTHSNNLPNLTKQFLQRYSQRSVTIIGSEQSISDKVENELKQIVSGVVERFSGTSIPELAVNFAKEKSKATNIGWGRNKPEMGNAFTFFPADWRYALIASLLSHLGKHTPLLPLVNKQLPAVYKQYLTFLRPEKEKIMPPFMHAYILGDFRQIPFGTQVEIEKSIKFKDM